ncbi:hypothetical protein WN982_34275 [Paraburkholderia sp. IMGN_8]|uniref:hypothetical protein n=1 Tax=Paraburkholderia sp. IMGN_8 TaxID=3136564 RepID=UPI0031016E05
MDSTTSPTKSELSALSEACATFDPSQRDQRMVIRLKVVPMLTRKLDDLRVALRANAHDESTQAMIDEITRALNHACVRLDCTFNSATDAIGSADETRMEAILTTLGARKKPVAKRNLKLDSNPEK